MMEEEKVEEEEEQRRRKGRIRRRDRQRRRRRKRRKERRESRDERGGARPALQPRKVRALIPGRLWLRRHGQEKMRYFIGALLQQDRGRVCIHILYDHMIT